MKSSCKHIREDTTAHLTPRTCTKLHVCMVAQRWQFVACSLTLCDCKISSAELLQRRRQLGTLPSDQGFCPKLTQRDGFQTLVKKIHLICGLWHSQTFSLKKSGECTVVIFLTNEILVIFLYILVPTIPCISNKIECF